MGCVSNEPDMNWRNIDIDHVRTVPSIDLSNDKKFKQAIVGKILSLC